MNKQPLLAVVAAALMVCGSAQAEFLIGGQGGFSESDGKLKTDSTGDIALADKENGSVFGVFGQYRHTLSGGTKVGVHLGWGGNSTEWKIAEDDVNSTFNVNNADGPLTFEMGDTIDLLGLVVFPGERVKPLMMLGYSSVEVEASYAGETDSATLSGYKVAFGAEFPFGANWVGHAMWHYADYGKEDIAEEYKSILGFVPSIETAQTGIRFGVAYSF